MLATCVLRYWVWVTRLSSFDAEEDRLLGVLLCWCQSFDQCVWTPWLCMCLYVVILPYLSYPTHSPTHCVLYWAVLWIFILSSLESKFSFIFLRRHLSMKLRDILKLNHSILISSAANYPSPPRTHLLALRSLLAGEEIRKMRKNTLGTGGQSRMTQLSVITFIAWILPRLVIYN